MLVSFADPHSAHDRRDVERRLAQALSGLGAAAETVPATIVDGDVSARDLLQLAWDRAEEEIEALQTELRLLRQRHQDAERQLLARIQQRKRLQQTILDSAGEATSCGNQSLAPRRLAGGGSHRAGSNSLMRVSTLPKTPSGPASARLEHSLA